MMKLRPIPEILDKMYIVDKFEQIFDAFENKEEKNQQNEQFVSPF